MIVRSASFESGRTVWRFDGEAGDRDLPRDSLWVNGLLRTIPAPLEAVWLAAVIGPFARRLVLPLSVDETLGKALGALFGATIVGAADSTGGKRHSGVYGATLVRDSLDEHLAARSAISSTFAVSVEHDPDGPHPAPGGFRVVTNGGTFRRHLEPLDRVGELAALAVAAPILGIQDMTAFVCREELSGVDTRLLTDAMSVAGLRLELPLGAVSVKELGTLARQHPSPGTAFAALYARYRMFPAILADVFEGLKDHLASSGGKTIAVKVADYIARSARADTCE